jgi:hypothetical protein
MRKIELPKGGQVLIHESSRELPINRFTDFQKFLIQEVGIGSTMGDVEKHFGALDQLIAGNKMEDAARERYNLHYNLHLAINRISIKHLSFLVHIHSINGHELTDFSESNLLYIGEELGKLGLTEALVSDTLSDIKKNSILN